MNYMSSVLVFVLSFSPHFPPKKTAKTLDVKKVLPVPMSAVSEVSEATKQVIVFK